MSVPQTQVDLFNSLAQQNQLSGVPADILVAIDLAESGGQPGFVNAEGYGGLFGLHANTNYPGGVLSSAQLAGTDTASLTAQSVICGSEFAGLLNRTGGDVYAAERIYQGGSNEGVGIMQSMGISQFIQWPPPPPPPPPPFIWEDDMIIQESDGSVSQLIYGGASSYWRLLPAPAAALIPGTMIIKDPNGVLKKLWKSGVAGEEEGSPRDEPPSGVPAALA